MRACWACVEGAVHVILQALLTRLSSPPLSIHPFPSSAVYSPVRAGLPTLLWGVQQAEVKKRFNSVLIIL